MKNEEIGYASVTGALHMTNGSPNQDSYLVKKYQFGTILVVSDGLGSRKHADIGAKAVGKAVAQAVRIWSSYKNKDIRLLLPLLVSMWSLEIYPYSQKDCAATCLFAIVGNNGVLYLAQLGDGDIYYAIDGECKILQKKEDDFSNMTKCLSGFSNYSDWKMKEIHYGRKTVCIAMMTDGVAETIIEGRREEFVKLLWSKLSNYSNLPERNKFIYKLLLRWNPINAGDDRTLICYKRR